MGSHQERLASPKYLPTELCTNQLPADSIKWQAATASSKALAGNSFFAEAGEADV